MRWSLWFRAVALAGLAAHLAAPNATGQETQPGTSQRQPSLEEAPAVAAPPPPSPLPPISAYPIELLGLLQPNRDASAIIPAIGISEEFNSNIFFDNNNPQSDFITAITPSVMMVITQPRYRLIAGVATSAEIYAKDTTRGNIFSRGALILGGDYQLTPDFKLGLSDAFSYDRGVGGGWRGFTVGRELSIDNRVSGGFTWLFPRFTLDGSASYELNRFPGSNSTGIDSDTYGFRTNLAYSVTQRLSASVGYAFSYLGIQDTDDSITHTPTFGLTYQITRQLSASASGGPAITQVSGETFVTPAGNVQVTQAWRWATLTLEYSRGISVAGGFGGTTDTQTAAGTFVMPTFIRDLVIRLYTSYNRAKSLDSGQTTVQDIDVTSYTVNLGAAYYFNPYISIFGGYDYIRQRTGDQATLQVDGDQHRVRVGFQLGYPIALR
jgi:predicted porin